MDVRRDLPAVGAALGMTMIFVAVLSIVLTASENLGLSQDRTATWIAVLYGAPAIPSLILTLRYRQPLLLTGNVFAIIFFASLGTRIGYAELAGAALLAGAVVLVAGVLGGTSRLGALIPAPVVQGLIAGALTPFVVEVFSGMSRTDAEGNDLPVGVPLMIGGALLAYLVSRRAFEERIPPIVPALLAGLVIAALTDQIGPAPSSLSLPEFPIVTPRFTFTAVLTATPVLVAVMALQANLPAALFMRGEGFDPPVRAIDVASGIGTIAGSLFGPIAVSLALPAMPLTAGPTAGARERRYRAVVAAALAMAAVGILATAAAELAVWVPRRLLLALAGLALIAALASALRKVASGPLVLGPLFAFVIALSDMDLLGLGSLFWALTIGTVVSFFLERDGWREANVSGRSR